MNSLLDNHIHIRNTFTFDEVEVYISNLEKLTQTDIAYIAKKYPNTVKLEINDVEKISIRSLASFKRLSVLKIQAFRVTIKKLNLRFLDSLPSLQKLYVSGVTLLNINNTKNLYLLFLLDLERIKTVKGINKLKLMPNLESFSISAGSIDSDDLSFLVSNNLSVIDIQVITNPLKDLSSIISSDKTIYLTCLKIFISEIKDLSFLSNLKRLSYLEISHSPLSENIEISNKEYLNHLDLSHSTEVKVLTLKKLPLLEKVIVTNCSNLHKIIITECPAIVDLQCDKDVRVINSETL